MPIAIGSHLASYEITALLGRGGMGEVFRGRDTKLKRDVAIKVLPEIFSRDRERVNRFVREAEVLASLNHPNIGTIYDFQEAEGIRFLVLELVEGETLAERIQRGPVPADEALQIARQICEALEAAHEKGIIHRDLKPANVKITAQGRVKVLDFGLAKALDAAPTEAGLSDSPTISLATNSGVILGTAAYMSPEQARAFSADTRSDVFSFGCVLYEMLTGGRAFQGETTSDVLASVLKSEPDYSRLPLKLHPRAQEMLRRCLAKDPKRRWQSVADLRIEIETILADPDGLSVAVRSKPVATPLWKYAMFLVGGAALAAVTLSFFLSRPSPTVSPTRFSIELPKDENLITGASVLAVSPDGSEVVYTGLQRAYRRLMPEFDMKAIPGSEGLGLRNPVFSPDGKSIAFFSYIDGALKRIPLAGGSPTLIGRIPAPWGICWYDDFLVFAINAAGSSIMRIDARGGQPETLIKLKEGELAFAPQVLPGGKTLLYTIATARSINRWDNARIVVQSLSAGEQPKVVLEGGADARYVSTGHLVYAVGGILRAVPFDLSRLQVTEGEPVVVVEGVLRAPANQMGTAHFSFSTNGSLVYLPGPVNAGGSPNVVGIIDRNGKLKTLPLPAGAYTNPRFSTDGKQLAVGTDDGKEANVYTYDLSGEKSLRRLTIEGANRFPLWSPDGQRIVFQSDRGGDRALWWQRANGTGIAERITKADEKTSHLPDSWLPGQKLLSFTLETGGTEADLWIVNVEDKKMSPLVQYPRLQVRSVFSHDGQWFAYQTTESGISEIWAQPYPKTGAKYQVLKANVVSAAPLWSKDGKELYFLDLLPGNGRVNAVKVTTQNGLEFSNPIPLPIDRFIQLPPPGNSRNYDLNQVNGDFVVILESLRDQTGSQAPVEIRVVLDSFEELKQRVPTR